MHDQSFLRHNRSIIFGLFDVFFCFCCFHTNRLLQVVGQHLDGTDDAIPESMDPYQTLGVSKSATQDDIKNAYRSLAKKFHPDLNPGKKEAEEKFKAINSAYELIGTKEAQEKFDRGETDQARAQQSSYQDQDSPFYSRTQQGGGRYTQGFEGGFSDEDIFSNLFGGRRASANPNRAGADELYRMDVDFKESILGSERTITLPGEKKLKVKIPAGIESGTKLRFRAQGGPGVGNGPAGDAYVEVTVTPLEGFKRVGRDLETEVAISFVEGILGAEIKVPTLDGAVMLKVPPAVSTGSRLRIRGKGVALTGEPGDQIVVLKIVLPKKVDPELQAAIQTWNGKYSYDPRSNS